MPNDDQSEEAPQIENGRQSATSENSTLFLSVIDTPVDAEQDAIENIAENNTKTVNSMPNLEQSPVQTASNLFNDILNPAEIFEGNGNGSSDEHHEYSNGVPDGTDPAAVNINWQNGISEETSDRSADVLNLNSERNVQLIMHAIGGLEKDQQQEPLEHQPPQESVDIQSADSTTVAETPIDEIKTDEAQNTIFGAAKTQNEVAKSADLNNIETQAKLVRALTPIKEHRIEVNMSGRPKRMTKTKPALDTFLKRKRCKSVDVRGITSREGNYRNSIFLGTFIQTILFNLL